MNPVYSLETKINNKLNELKALITLKEINLEPWEIRHAKYIDFGNYDYLDDWQTLNIGDFWATSGETAFIKKNITLTGWTGEYIALLLDTDGEGLLYLNGKPFHGVDNFRGYICLTPSAKETETFNLLIEHKAGGYEDFEDKPIKHIFKEAKLLSLDKELESIYYDYLVPFDVACHTKDEITSKLVKNLVYDSLLSVNFNKDRDTVKKALTEEIKVFKDKLSTLPKAPGAVHFIGNSHIDLVFMWPERETHRKVGRTFNSLCRLMEEFPHYYFMCSQVPIYEFLQKYYPETYSQIKELIKAGRFEPIGGTYVQHSTNLLSGESLVRQCLYGKRFFKKEFNYDVKIGWLPDTFGFVHSLPQIYKQAGIDTLITQKLRYNDTNSHYEDNTPPELNFNWEGCDGSKLLVYHTGSYKHLTTSNMEFMLYNLGYYYNKVKHLPMPDYLAPYGFGDGGGGPNRRELEYIKRLNSTPGFPKVKTGLVKKCIENLPCNNLNTVNGELYLEAHRGTYTSQGEIKKLNRLCEIGLRNCEILGVITQNYDKTKLATLWKKTLFNHFHDILPGSSIHEGVKDAETSFSNVLSETNNIISESIKSLAESADTEGVGIPIFVFNPLSFNRKALVSVPFDRNYIIKDKEGNILPSQFLNNNLIFNAKIRGFEGQVYFATEGKNDNKSPITFENNTIDTPLLKITLKDGYISQIYDKDANRDLLEGKGNELQVFEDKGGFFDAWDIDPLFEKNKEEFILCSEPTLMEIGPVRCVIRSEYKYNKSSITQDMIVYPNSKRIDFKTQANWHESHTMLKASFKVNIRSTEATYEIPYGSIKRPTTRNNNIERAKFEVCGQRWADLSEPNYGISILNDCKYGYDIKDNEMRITLLRSPKHPDATCDMGDHEFTYSLFPHATCLLKETVKEAHSLNNPLLSTVTDNHKGEELTSFVNVLTDNVIIDCIKLAEDTNDIVLRLYEPYGQRENVTLSFDKNIKDIKEINILEEEIGKTDFSFDSLSFFIKPFEIKSFLIK